MFSDENIAEALSPRIQSLIVLPTEKCNFRCAYCYEDFSIGRMQAPVIRGLNNFIGNRAPHIDRLSISWFGGEPLLAQSVIREVGRHAHSVSGLHGVEFRGGMTTNGYFLTAKLLEELLEISHSEYQITLDGDREWHDKTRITAKKEGTFEKIWKNLVSYKELPFNFDISLRLHLHQENVSSMRRLYSMLAEHLLSDKRFSASFHKVSNLGGPSEVFPIVPLDRKSYLDAIDYVMQGYLPTRPGKPLSEEHLDNYICYASKPNSLVIRANGGVAKCTVALNDERNDIGVLQENGELDIKNEKLRKWMHGFPELSAQSLGCPLSTLT
ncbi:radical SAM protein [Xanthomonas campestris]|uniref:radical SAM protein n=1 Tax=Xanthomonas campestris TaxID=339 RepID=UPI001E3EF322|nr:radical SAM protein [Xanthomonas campestris]MCC5084790.1 hypothetical protein [Xanthomonas campestris]